MAKQVTEIIAKRGYNLIGDLDDEQDALESFENEYDGSTYICDAISEIADSNIPIYTHDLWKNAQDIREHIEEAVDSGLAGEKADIDRMFQAGYYQYYSQSLYNNLETMIYNIMADKINDALDEMEEDYVDSLEISEIEDDIEHRASEIDNNNRFDDIQDAVNEIIDAIKNRDDEEEDEE